MPLTRNRIACERHDLPRTSTLYKRRGSTRRWHLDPAELLAHGPQHAALVLVEMGHFLVHLWGHERTRKGLVWRILAVPDAFHPRAGAVAGPRPHSGAPVHSSSLQFTRVCSSSLQFLRVRTGVNCRVQFTPLRTGRRSSNWSELAPGVRTGVNWNELP